MLLNKKIQLILLIGFFFSGTLTAQKQEKVAVPAISILRAEENYSFLKDQDSIHFFLKEMKFIALNKKATSYLTLGGEYRPRIETTFNKDYTEVDETHYSQRIALHASLNLGPRIRVFTEFYHGLISDGESFVDSDQMDFHQAFLDWTVYNKNEKNVKFRIGRQEIGYGASRLIGIREGPNLRRSFDMAKLVVRKKLASMDLFYGKEVFVSPNAFDNKSYILNDNGKSPSVWGIFLRHPAFNGVGKIDLYYFGFHSNFSAFNDVVGEELRHSFGLRSFGKKENFFYNTELTLQIGELGDNNILAYNFETDWKYAFSEYIWHPAIGVKLDFSSGDRSTNDGKSGTFNPLFVNPAIYSLASINTPANLMSIHPHITFNSWIKWYIYLEYALFYRTQTEDGLYVPPRILLREASGTKEKHIGDTMGLHISHKFNRYITFEFRCSYFNAGQFIKESGASENIFSMVSTVSFRI